MSPHTIPNPSKPYPRPAAASRSIDTRNDAEDSSEGAGAVQRHAPSPAMSGEEEE